MPEPSFQALFRIADRQAGYFTSAQALAAGYSRPNQSYHRKAGHWLRAGWGLYRLRDYPRDPDEPLARLTLWSRDRAGRPQAVVSHESALQRFDLSDVMPLHTHLTVPKRFRKTPPDGVILHKADLAPADHESRGPYRITTVQRTLIDVATATTSEEHLRAAVSEALRRGLARREGLERALHDLDTDAAGRLRRALEEA